MNQEKAPSNRSPLQKLALLSLGPAFMALAACSSTPAVQDYPATANPGEEVLQLSKDLDAAKLAQVDMLSPRNFKEADSYLKKSQEQLSAQKDGKTVLHSVAISHSYLKQANDVAAVAHTNIDDVITARQQAITAGAPKTNSKEFQKVDNQLEKVTKDIENNKPADAIAARNELQLKYLDLELKAIKETHLGQAHANIDQGIKNGAKKFAPTTLAVAQKDVSDADAFITANRHDTAAIEARSDKALKSSTHLLQITQGAKMAKGTSPETTALLMENQQHQISAEEAEANAKADALNREEAANRELSADNQSDRAALDRKRKLDEQYAKAQAQFSSQEAEVYRKGDSVVIRLRSLDFPSAKSTLKSRDFPLLSKVETVIQGFGMSQVTVEGYTDSVGSSEKNMKLSEDRAHVVESYLSTHNKTDTASITAVGYGDQNPLASNKTASGRAENRRVDVVITPTGNSSSGTEKAQDSSKKNTSSQQQL